MHHGPPPYATHTCVKLMEMQQGLQLQNRHILLRSKVLSGPLELLYLTQDDAADPSCQQFARVLDMCKRAHEAIGVYIGLLSPPGILGDHKSACIEFGMIPIVGLCPITVYTFIIYVCICTCIYI